MKNKLTLEWLYAALVRAIKTIAQTALGMITVGAALDDIQWGRVLSVALVAGLISILTSIATNLPEVGTDGDLIVMSSINDNDIFRFKFNDQAGALGCKKKVTFLVKSEIPPSQEKPSL